MAQAIRLYLSAYERFTREFGHTIAHRSFLDVLAQRPPTIIIHFLEVLLRALEKRYVFFHPLRCAGIGNSLGYILILHAVEIIHVGLEILIFQESRTGILISRSRLESWLYDRCTRVPAHPHSAECHTSLPGYPP